MVYLLQQITTCNLYSYKRIFCLLLALLSASVGYAQKTLTGAGTPTTGTWTPSLPVAGDNIILANGATLTINIDFTFGNITMTGGNSATTININAGRTMNANDITIGEPTSNNVTNQINVGNGTLNAASITMPETTADNRRCGVLIADGRANITNGVTMNTSMLSPRNFIRITGTGIFDLRGGNFTGGGSFEPVSTVPPAAPNQSKVIYSGSNNQNIIGTTNGYFNLELQHTGSSTKTLAAGTDVLGDLLAVGDASKPIFQLSSFNLIVSGTTTLRLTTMADNSITGITNLNTVIMQGGRINGTVTSSIFINGNLIINTNPTNSISEIGQVELTVLGTSQIAAGATLEWNNIQGEKILTGKVTINGAWNNTANENITLRGGLEHNGFSFNSGTGTYSFTTNNQDISGTSSIVFDGQVIVGSNVRLINTVSQPIDGLVINGLLNGTDATSVFENRTLLRYAGLNQRPMQTGGLDADHPGNTIDYHATAGTQVINTSGTPFVTVYHHLIISNGGEKRWVNTIAAATVTRAVNGNLTLAGGTLVLTHTATQPVINVAGNFLQEGGTLNLSSRDVDNGFAQLNIGGNFTQNAGTVTITGNSAGAVSSLVRLNGAAMQTAFQNAAVNWDRGTFAVNNINRVMLASNFSASRLLLETGVLQTGATGTEYEFRVTDDAPNAVGGHVATGFNFGTLSYGSAPNNYVFGKLRRNVQNVNNVVYDFPVGSNTRYELARLSITTSLNVSHVTAWFNNTNALNSFSVSGCIRAYSPCTGGFWTFHPDTPISGTYAMQLFPNGFNCGNSNVCDGPTIARRADATAAWGFSGSTFAANYTRTGFSAFSDFVPVFEDQPTPVEWVSFTATKQETSALLQWATAWEKDAETFIIEKSTDGKRWINIGQVAARGSSNQLTNYQFIDKEPFTGINYYRLAQRDFDGTIHHSSIISLIWEGSVSMKSTLRLFPNPVHSGSKVYFNDVFQSADIVVSDISGRAVHQQTLANESALQLPVLPSGVYLLKIATAGQQATLRVVVE
jgi:hypothetical protein